MKLYSTFALAGALTFATIQTDAQIKMPAPSPLQSTNQAFGLSSITVEYSRPSAKGRTVFGELVPYGKIWRTGANASTKITFGDNVIIGGKDISAGTYALYTIPNAQSWDVMLTKDLKLGGNVSKYDASQEVARWNLKSTPLKDKIETFTIQFANITSTTLNIELLWENTKLSLPVSTEIDSRIMKDIEQKMEKDNRPYFQAASYYYSNDKDLNKALGWINKAVEQNPKAFYMYALKSRIQLKQNNKSGAAATAQQVIKYATDAKNDDYIKIGQDLLKKAK